MLLHHFRACCRSAKDVDGLLNRGGDIPGLAAAFGDECNAQREHGRIGESVHVERGGSDVAAEYGGNL
jgi:hypothetical protein